MTDTDASSATPINLPLERSLYVGDILRGILYGESSPQLSQQSFCSHLTHSEAGMEIVTFFASLYCVTYRPSRYYKSQKFYVIYGGILLLLTTIELSLHALWGQLMWIDQRNYPGGPLGFYLISEAAWYTATALAAGVAANILGDGLLVCPITPRWTLNRRLTQWLNRTVVPMLHNLELTMAYHRLSSTDILGLRWYASCHTCHSFRGVAHRCDFGAFLSFFVLQWSLSSRWWSLPYQAQLS
jgi:hypothetical protein